jgi:hypothetical protein
MSENDNNIGFIDFTGALKFDVFRHGSVLLMRKKETVYAYILDIRRKAAAKESLGDFGFEFLLALLFLYLKKIFKLDKQTTSDTQIYRKGDKFLIISVNKLDLEEFERILSDQISKHGLVIGCSARINDAENPRTAMSLLSSAEKALSIAYQSATNKNISYQELDINIDEVST